MGIQTPQEMNPIFMKPHFSKALLVLILIGLNIPSAWAQTGWKVDTYVVEFEITNAGVTVDGNLSGLRYQLAFSPDALAQSKIVASVDVNTIETGIGARDSHLKDEDYFEVEKYPTIRMESKSFRKTGTDRYVGTFSLTIRDVTRQIEVPFEFTRTGNQAKLAGEFMIDRLDYGVGESSWVMGDEVDVYLTLNVTAKN